MKCDAKVYIKSIVEHVNKNAHFGFVRLKDFDADKAVLEFPNDIAGNNYDYFSFIIPAAALYQSDAENGYAGNGDLRIKISFARCDIELRCLYITNISEIQKSLSEIKIFSQEQIASSRAYIAVNKHHELDEDDRDLSLKEKCSSLIFDLIALSHLKGYDFDDMVDIEKQKMSIAKDQVA